MIEEMAETRERIYREFSEGCRDIGCRYVGKVLDGNTIECVRKEVSELMVRITNEVGVSIVPGEITASANGSVSIEEPYVELHNGGRCKLSDWLTELQIIYEERRNGVGENKD